MVVVDRFPKMAHFIRLQENATGKVVAEAFLKEVWKLHGYHRKSFWIWMRSLRENFGSHCVKDLGLRGKC